MHHSLSNLKIEKKEGVEELRGKYSYPQAKRLPAFSTMPLVCAMKTEAAQMKTAEPSPLRAAEKGTTKR